MLEAQQLPMPFRTTARDQAKDFVVISLKPLDGTSPGIRTQTLMFLKHYSLPIGIEKHIFAAILTWAASPVKKITKIHGDHGGARIPDL